jgi:hypothetical protein
MRHTASLRVNHSAVNQCIAIVVKHNYCTVLMFEDSVLGGIIVGKAGVITVMMLVQR